MFVVGMHRSGTSATTSVALGCGLKQDEDVLPAHASNPGGHFESLSLYRANDKILNALGYTWDAPPGGPLASNEIRHIRELGLIEDYSKQFRKKSVQRDWCDKDPRLCITLPLWDEILFRRVPVVVCIRDPHEVALSLALREGMPYEYALAIWRIHNRHIARTCMHRDTFLVDYKKLVEDPQDVSLGLKRFIRDCRYETGELVRDCSELIKKNYQRNVASSHSEVCERRRMAAEEYEMARVLPVREWHSIFNRETELTRLDEQWLGLYRRAIGLSSVPMQESITKVAEETSTTVALEVTADPLPAVEEYKTDRKEPRLEMRMRARRMVRAAINRIAQRQSEV